MWAENNEQKFENLSNYIIKKELKLLHKRKVFETVIMILVLVPFLYLMFLFCDLLFKPIVTYTVFGISGTLLFSLLIKEIVSLFKTITKSKNFTVTTAKLVNADDKMHITRQGVVYYTYHLKFNGYEEYQIPSYNYEWSHIFNMSDKGVFNYSVLGDEFYLIIINDKIQLVYNCKLFKYIQ